MGQDKYSAVWVSNSSMRDFLDCPRLYYLRNVYKDPKTGHKVNIVNPSLALGQAVHEVLEALSFLDVEDRLRTSLFDKYNVVWEKVSGKRGGFRSVDEEVATKERGRQMIGRVVDNPGIILRKTIKIKRDDPNYLPNYYLSKEDKIILCGKIDWLEYIEIDKSVHIVDFKTGRHDERPDSLQLPIYNLLVTKCQSKKVSKGSYWYLDRDDEPREVELPALDEAFDVVLDLAKKVKQARLAQEFLCPKYGCRNCDPFEAIIKGQAEFVGVGGYSQDLYILK